MESNVNFKYYAFISYSHEDEEYAKRIQKKLTEYKLPSVIRKANPLLPDNVRPIFRDATNLTTGMLQETLHSELEHSKFLIVLCSPNSAKPNDESKHWVNNEVQHFIDLGRAEFIIPVIVSGEPHAENPEEECFCPALLSLPGGDELLGIDIRKTEKQKKSFGKNIKRKLGIPDENDLEEKATVHIVAKMLGLDIDDLWDWNKKAQKRKAYARLFSVAAAFLMMLTAGLVVYFKQFHVYHKYYVDYVERAIKRYNGTDIKFVGLGQLTSNEIKSRESHLRFDYKAGKLIKIVNENSVRIPISSMELEYNEKTEYVQAVVTKNMFDSVLMRNEYGQQGTVIDLKNKDGFPTGRKAKVTSSSNSSLAIVEQAIANIKSYKLERNRFGYTVKKMYFRSNGAEDVAKDADGIAGYEFVLDNLGRPVQTWYLGLNNNNFERQPTKDGIAGYFLEYDRNYNICKTIYVNSDGKPSYNKSCGYTICINKYKKGNMIKESYHDANGSLCPNSDGIAYYTCEYDRYGNRKCISYYDENKHYTYTNDFFAIQKNAFDKNGYVIETNYYDINGNLCTTKHGVATVKFEYLKNGNTIKSKTESYYNIEGESVRCEDGYAKQIAVFNSNGDVEDVSYFDNEGKRCLNLYGYSKRKDIYDENHRLIEQSFYNFAEDGHEYLVYNPNIGGAGIIIEYENGNPITVKTFDENSNFIKTIKRKFYDSGNLQEEFYYDVNGEPMPTEAGYVGIGLTYDEVGNIISTSYYKDFGKTLCNSKPDNFSNFMNLVYAYFENEWDERGNRICTRLYNAQKELISPFCIIKREFDENNNETKTSFYDKNLKLVKNNVGYAQSVNEYDKYGRQIKQIFLDEFGNPTLCGIISTYYSSSKYASKIFKYDVYGRLSEESFYDANGVLKEKTLLNSKGMVIEDSFYKNETELECNENGYSVMQFEYDNRNNNILVAFYDENKKPTAYQGPVLTGLAKIESEYDIKGLCVSKYYDKDLVLIYESSDTEEYTLGKQYEKGICVYEKYKYLNGKVVELFYENEKLVRKIEISADGTETETVYE